MYLPPYDVLSQMAELDREIGRATIPIGALELLLKVVAVAAGFDEKWYEAMNPDVARAIRSGIIQSGLDHFVSAGYFEGRHMSPMEVDSDWYLATYADVREGVESGLIATAHTHYNANGYAEGRAPSRELEAIVNRWMHLAKMRLQVPETEVLEVKTRRGKAAQRDRP